MIDGDLIVPRPADGEAALGVTLDWLHAHDSTDELGALVPEPLDDSGTSDTLAEHLAAAGLMGWSDAIVAAAAAEPGRSRHLDPRLRWLMSQAALEVAVDTDQPGFFRSVEVLRTLGEVSDATLASAVCSRVADTSEDYPLLSRLLTRLQALWKSHFNERLRRYAEATGTRPPTSRDLWPGHDGMPVGDGWAHQVAAVLWPHSYMEMLASFPTPFQHGFGDPLSLLDLELAASLVRASPRVFSNDGTPLGPVVVFVLLDKVERQLIDFEDVTAAKMGIVSLLDSVFSRSDGDWIGRAWLQQIIWRDTPRRAGRAETDVSAQRDLRNMLLARLSERITPLGEDVFDWVRQEEPLWVVHRVLAEASILETHGDATGAAEILAGAVRRGLVCSTGRPAGLVAGSPEATVVARVLSRLPDMIQWFETLWRDTYELREHLSYEAHRDLDNPAYPALTWGLIGLNSSQMTPVDLAGFWRTLAAAVFETQRIDPNASLFNGAMLPITRVTVQLGATLVDRDALPIRDFANFLADQLEPTAEHARLWQIARSAASDDVTLAMGRLVGAPLLRQALEAGLTQNLPKGGSALNSSVRDDLADFSSRL